MSPTPEQTAIASLNDQLRHNFLTNPTAVGGPFKLMLTQGVQSLPTPVLDRLLSQVAAFNAFTDGNDPHGERDFGAIDAAGTRYFWKIDYYDTGLRAASPNPGNPRVTIRVLTIMRADEY